MELLRNEFLEISSNSQGILYKVSLVYFKSKTDREDNFQEIVYQLWKSYPKLKNKNSVGSWIYAIGIPIGLFVSYYAVRKIRKYQLLNLEFLKGLYGRLHNVR